MMRPLSALLCAGLLTLSSTLAIAQSSGFERHPLEDISQTAVSYALTLMDDSAYSNVEASSQAMDDRLRLKRCDVPLEASINSTVVQAGRTSVQVRCSGTNPWSLYVPVKISATTPVVIVKGPLPRGTILMREHLELKDVAVEALPANFLSNVDDVIGQELLRYVNNESYASAHMMKIKNLIQKGQQVVILAKNQNLEVRMAGVALEPGQHGDQISVKNSASGRTIQGKVTDSGDIVVSL